MSRDEEVPGLSSPSPPWQGTRDHPPAQAALRERLLGTVVACFKRHGAAAIDTPVLELRVRSPEGLGAALGTGEG